MFRATFAVAILMVVAIGVLPASSVVLIDDFEEGVGAWTTNDAIVAGREPAKPCGIYTTSNSAADRGEQAAMVEFLEGESTWASVTISIDGQSWAQHNCTALSMWLRGDGSDSRVNVVLRASCDRADNPDVAYSQPVFLRSTQWQKLGLRFLGFKSKEGQMPTDADLPHLTLLQFVKEGSWQPCRFYVDEIWAESEDNSSERQEEILEVDFRRWSETVRVQIGCNFGAAGDLIEDGHEGESRIGDVLRGLVPCVIRFVLDDYLDPDQEHYDIQRLNQHVGFVQHQGAKALICLYPPAGRSGDEPQKDKRLQQIFSTTVRQLVEMRAGQSGGRYYELLSRPLLRPDLATTHDVVDVYTSLASEVLQSDPGAWIGGPGLASPWEEYLSGFVKAADRLDFLSYHFWGGHTPVVAASQLIAAARSGQSSDLPRQLSFEGVRTLAREQRHPEAFVTQVGLNSAATSAAQKTSEHFTGSWLAMTALAAAPYVDKLLYTPLVGEKVGFVDEAGRATAVYRAAWLVRTYMPRGSKLCHWLYPDEETVVAAIHTPTANNAVIAYGGEGPRAFTIKVQHAGKLGLVRARKVDTSAREIQFIALPVSTEQTLEMAGPGVMVVQFIGGG